MEAEAEEDMTVNESYVRAGIERGDGKIRAITNSTYKSHALMANNLLPTTVANLTCYDL